LQFGYLSGNLTFPARIAINKYNRIPASGTPTNIEVVMAKDFELKSFIQIDLTDYFINLKIEKGKYISLGIMRLDTTTHTLGLIVKMDLEDF